MTAERYTAVFTGYLLAKKPGECLYLSMSEDPLAPGDSVLRRGQPWYEHMGREILLDALPKNCRQLVLDTYRDLWGL